MAFSFTQQNTKSQANTDASNNATIAYTSLNAAKSILIFFVQTGNNVSPTGTISDSAGNTWVDMGLLTGGNQFGRLFYCVSAKSFGSLNTVTIHCSTNGTLSANLVVLEYSPGVGSATFTSGIGALVATSTISPGTITSTANNLLLQCSAQAFAGRTFTPALANVRINTALDLVQDTLSVSAGSQSGGGSYTPFNGGCYSWLLAFAPPSTGVPNSLMQMGVGI